MTVRQAAALIAEKVLEEGDMEREISTGLCCDVLSQAMAKGESGMALITVHASMNALAVAVMLDAACLIFPEGHVPEKNVVERARTERMALLASPLPAFEIAGRLYEAGLRGERT